MKLGASDVAVVTGAATGMGRELALQLAQRAVSLALCDVDMEQLAKTVTEVQALGGADLRISSHHCDVSDPSSVRRFRDEVVAHHGKVTMLFNNAGVGGNGQFVFAPDTSEADLAQFERNWDRVFNVCFHGVVHCTRAFLPLLQEAASRGEAYLVNTSSVAGLWSIPLMTSYVAAKHAVKGFTESLMAECAMKYPTLHVACVHPGGVKTEIAAKSLSGPGDSPEKRDRGIQAFAAVADLTAKEAVECILTGVARNSTRIIVGWDATFMDIAARVGPRWSYEIFAALGRSGWRMRGPEDTTPPTGMQLLKTMLGGGWYMALAMSPLALVQASRHPAFQPLAAGVAAASLYTGLRHRSKL